MYKIVTSGSLDDLEEKCTALIRKGWKPSGNVIFLQVATGFRYYQTMYRDTEE